MNRKVVLSKIASQKLDELFEYLQFNWSKNEKIGFINKLNKRLEQTKSQ